MKVMRHYCLDKCAYIFRNWIFKDGKEFNKEAHRERRLKEIDPGDGEKGLVDAQKCTE